LIQDQARMRNLDSRNPAAQIRLFQISIPQLLRGDFFNSIGHKQTSKLASAVSPFDAVDGSSLGA
jgi:hypothetical protein